MGDRVKQLKRAQSVGTAIKTVVNAFDGKTIMALAMGMLAMVIASYPETGLAVSLAGIGISPKGFSVYMVACAGLILRFPNDKVYAVCVLPYLVVLIALIDLVIRTNSTPASVIPFAGFFILALREGGR